MQSYTNNVQDRQGNAIAGAQVLVLKDGATAVIYSDNGITPATNPLTTDANGSFTFYGPTGNYSLTITSPKLPGPVEYTGIPILDPDDFDFTLRDDLASDSSGKGAELVSAEDGSGGTAFTTVAGFITRILSSVGAALVGFIQAGVGAIARTVQDKLRESVSVKDFGAVGDGVTDDTAAISAALDTAVLNKLQLHFPAGRYIVSSTISKTLSGDGSLKMFGDGENITIIELNTGGDGLSFTLPGNWYLDGASGNNGLQIEDMTFTTTNENIGQGVTVLGNSLAGRPGAKVSFENVEFRCKSAFGQAWGRAVSINDCQDVWFNHCRFIQGGPSNITANGLFINGTAVDNSPTTVFINHCDFLYGNIQMEVGDYVEGIYVTNCAMVGGVIGILMNPVVGESGLHVMGGHISSTLYNIDCLNVFDFEIIGALLYRSGTTTPNFSNIRIQNGGRFVISGNVFKGSNTNDGEVGVNIVSTINNEQQGGFIGNNSFHLFATRAIWLNSGAYYTYIGENLYRGCAVRVLNQAAAAKGNGLAAREYAVTVARTLTGGAVTENIDLTLPAGLFRIKPGAGLVNADAGSVLAVNAAYDFGASSETNARIVVRNPAGGNIAAGTYRFHVALFEQSYSSSF